MMLLWILACGPKSDVQEGDCSPFYYENFGAGFVTENCQGCHAQSADDREGAPQEVSFDDISSILDHRDLIIYEIEEETMPPAGGIPTEDRDAALEWLNCMEEQ